MRLSLIVPVLNEAARIEKFMETLARLDGIHEIIVVDGGSRDETAQLVARHPQVRWIGAPRSRALQMNAGAAAATGDVLWFVHADACPPSTAAREIERVLADRSVVAGAFRIWTIDDAHSNRWLAPFLHLADLRSRYTGLPYGDQAMFVRTQAFRAVGGFPEQPLLEDLELSRRLRRLGRIRTIRANVLVSGRRFLTRPVYYTLAVNLFPLLYRCGVPAERLARWYENIR